jgi:hypothetical protein
METPVNPIQTGLKHGEGLKSLHGKLGLINENAN